MIGGRKTTREEAANVLAELWGTDYHYYLDTKEAEAVDTAIEVLKEKVDKKDNKIAYLKYRLTLSVWLCNEKDEVELKTERRGAEYVMPIGLFDNTAKIEAEVVDRLCEAIRGLYVK